jgi:hypothetical protein
VVALAEECHTAYPRLRWCSWVYLVLPPCVCVSNKLGALEQVVSFPKGGDSLKGIGEKFSPDSYTVTAGTYSVPIALAPDHNRFRPGLTEGYSGGAGNGPFGLCWSPSMPRLVRLAGNRVVWQIFRRSKGWCRR